jgi:UDP-N-acetylmuramoylalanine-D-glutamate ligase
LPLSHIIVTNVDVDHLDHFGSFAQLQDAMVEVIAKVTGVVVMNADDVTSKDIARRVHNSSVRTFGYHIDADVKKSGRQHSAGQGVRAAAVAAQRKRTNRPVCFLCWSMKWTAQYGQVWTPYLPVSGTNCRLFCCCLTLACNGKIGL